MDGEEITDGELKDLIKRFEMNFTEGEFDYYTPENLNHIIDYYIDKPNYKNGSQSGASWHRPTSI